MNKTLLAALTGVALAAIAAPATAQSVAGKTTLGVSVTELQQVMTGWSAKRQILDKDVYNDKGDKVGEISDIIIAPDRSVSYAIVETGGFLGIDEHRVAIPAGQFTEKDGKMVLPGATKEAIEAMPPFKYAKPK